MSRSSALILSLALSFFAACGSTGQRASDDAQYVLAYLKTGPRAAEKSKEENQTIFAGHMANIHRLAEQRKLVIAGPFAHPHDASWRGIFVLDVSSIDEARQLVDTDPGVQAQVFAVELHPLQASRALRTALDLEQESKAIAARDNAAAQAGMDVRAYVMITAQDAARAERALAPLRERGRLIWCGRLGGELAGQGVFVLDAEKVADVDALIGDARAHMGECSIDSWWSTGSLVGLATASGTER